jgi:hypothetical protein
MQLMNAALAAGGGPSNTTKRLGQLSITYDGVAAELPGDIRKNLQDCMREAGVVISAANGTLIMSAVKSLSNTKLLHPMSDVAWGRMPRKVQNNGLIGPWSPATRDHQTYDDTSSTISEDGAISGTYFL